MKGIIYIYVLFFYVSILPSLAQEGQSYKVRYQTFVEGDMKVIGNNIVNRNAPFSPSNKPFDELGNSVQHNDQFSMEYIDIDGDPSTFSSSSAVLKSPQNSGKIIYAGLYWSATYPYGKGSTKDYQKYKIEDEKRENFTSVKIKLPQASSYEEVRGTIIYDGEQSKEFQDIMPYVVYSDITNIVKKSANPWGEYTIANVRATQGQIPGGVSAGWTMIVVYEETGSPTKKIITYDGFKDIFKNKVEVEFSGFRTPETGKITAELAGSALEGDHSIPGSRLAISTENSKETYLSTSTRPERNFFNSGITNGNHFVEERNPASKNTLGYDIYTLEIPNKDNAIIGNDVSKMILAMPASPDRYYSFFTALSISSEDLGGGVKEEEKETPVVIPPKEDTPKIPETPKNLTQNTSKIEEKIPNTQESVSVRNLTLDEIPQGFYNVVGVFITGISAERQKASFYKKGYQADYIYDPASNKRYVYIYRSDTFEQALEKQKEMKENELFKDTWILAVNAD